MLALTGDVDGLNKLITLNPLSINAQNDKGYSILHWSLIGKQQETFKFLISKGADPALKTLRGETTLHWAVRLNLSAIVEDLIRLSPQLLNLPNSYGFTPLHFCTSTGNVEIYKILRKHNANLFVTNNYMATPLHWACHSEGCSPNTERYKGKKILCLEIMKEIETHPDKLKYINILNKIGRTALHWACLSNYQEVVELLLASGSLTKISFQHFPSVYTDALNNKFSEEISSQILNFMR
jgi:ankyrin repeat protein